ncbi:6-phosphofructokinase [Longilinea arvoryzae]|uniref:6-phosphofructokinase n=1 Tax=Longilinea arvoryzae TaxID=360412 RepID=A0A0S7BKB5_9CHLR|nr:ATP-dependent 6-phosphofructokinase [Longilinea arvoryzae]GAP15059.1 6-phosphofructokinase [Longilinea arvoryzae]
MTGKRIGILTAGSDSPGLNAAIRAIGKAALSEGFELIGFQDGFTGLLEDRTIPLEASALSNILTAGGTILGTSKDRPHEMEETHGPEHVQSAIDTYHRHKLDGLVCLGGRDTQASALYLLQRGLKVITLPKSIENNIALTETSVGFDTALGIAAEAIDRLHSTAHSNHRIIVVEITGHTTGWLTLGAGIASGADVILIPEIPYNMDIVAEAILKRSRAGKRFSLVAVAEGSRSQDDVAFYERSLRLNASRRSGKEAVKAAARIEKLEEQFTGNTLLLANRLEQLTGLETRTTILGFLLRGGTPSATDRVLATQFGSACVSYIEEDHYGIMVAQQGGKITAVPLEDVAGKIKAVPTDHPWLKGARRVGTSLGD